MTKKQIIVKSDKSIWVHVAILSMGSTRMEQTQWSNVTMKEMRSRQGYNITVSYSMATPVMNNRAKIVKQFRAMGADWLMMLDEDCVPHANPFDLIELDYDIIGFPAPIQRGVSSPGDPIIWNVELIDDEGNWVSECLPVGGEPIEVAAIGTGGILIARRVLEAMPAPFVEPVDKFGERVVGGDIFFCRRARKLGFKVWAAPSMALSHIKPTDLYTVWELLHPGATKLEPTMDKFGPWDLEGWGGEDEDSSNPK